jgi:hypothetical protein
VDTAAVPAAATYEDYYDDYEAEGPPQRAGLSPWIYVLGAVAAALLILLAVLLALLVFGNTPEEVVAPDDAPAPAIVLPDVTLPAVDELVSTAEALLPTVAPVATTEPVVAGGSAAGGGGAASEPAVQWQDILGNVQAFATSMAPLFPLGTPGAPPGSTRYPAPILVAPGNGASLHGQGAVILLTWEAVGELQGDEYYHVSLRYSQQGQIQFAGDWVQATEWRVPEWLYGQADQGRFEWDVTVRQATRVRADGGKEGPALSPKSETRFFLWTEKRQEERDDDNGKDKEPPPEFEK